MYRSRNVAKRSKKLPKRPQEPAPELEEILQENEVMEVEDPFLSVPQSVSAGNNGEGDHFFEESSQESGDGIVFDEAEVDVEQAEVMELSGAGHDITEGQPLFITISQFPGPTRSYNVPAENLQQTVVDEDHSFDAKSNEDEIRRLQWLSYPTRILNKVKSEKDLGKMSESLGGFGDLLKDTRTDSESEEAWETMSEDSSSSGEIDPDGDWEESLVYVELDDLPSVQELFALNPDDFLRFQHRNKRHLIQPLKATHPKLTFKFHDFDSPSPTLQIGQRYFTGLWEEPSGTSLFFRKRGEVEVSNSTSTESAAPKPSTSTSSFTTKSKTMGGKKDNKTLKEEKRPCAGLKSIVPEPEIPFDPLFKKLGVPYKNSYELVSMADKVLKLQAHVASSKKMPKGTKQGLTRTQHTLKAPKGYSIKDILAGNYKPLRSYPNKKQKVRKMKWKEVQGELTVLGIKNQETDEIMIDDDDESDADVSKVRVLPMESIIISDINDQG